MPSVGAGFRRDFGWNLETAPAAGPMWWPRICTPPVPDASRVGTSTRHRQCENRHGCDATSTMDPPSQPCTQKSKRPAKRRTPEAVATRIPRAQSDAETDQAVRVRGGTDPFGGPEKDRSLCPYKYDVPCDTDGHSRRKALAPLFASDLLVQVVPGKSEAGFALV